MAAFIGEPVLGTGGIIPPPEGYWAEIQAVLRRTRRAADRRRGDHRLRPDRALMFGSRHLRHRARPDHARQGPNQRLCAALRRDRRREGLAGAGAGVRQLGAFGHGWTYSAHPLCAAAANAVLDIVEREDLPGNAREVGADFLAPAARGFRRSSDWSARSAASGCWRRSSSSPTGRPRRRSTPALQGRAQGVGRLPRARA